MSFAVHVTITTTAAGDDVADEVLAWLEALSIERGLPWTIVVDDVDEVPA